MGRSVEPKSVAMSVGLPPGRRFDTVHNYIEVGSFKTTTRIHKNYNLQPTVCRLGRNNKLLQVTIKTMILNISCDLLNRVSAIDDQTNNFQ